MKQYAGLTVNVAKSIKAGEDDTNEEQVYAELNILVSETKYEISNARDIVRTRDVDEIEIIVDAKQARQISLDMLDLAERLDEAAEKEKEKDRAYKEWVNPDI